MLAAFLSVILIALTIFGSIWWLLRARDFNRKSLNMPGPIAIPLLGNVLTGIMNNFDFLRFTNCLSKYGDVVRFWLGPYPCVMVGSKENLQTFFTHKGLMGRPEQGVHILEQIIGPDNVLTSVGEPWRKARGAMTHALNTVPLADIWSKMMQKNVDLIKIFGEQSQDNFFACVPFLRRHIFSVITKLSLEHEEDHFANVGDHYQVLLDIVMLRIFSPLHHWDVTFYLLKEGSIFRDSMKKSWDSANSILAAARKEREDYIAAGVKPPNNILQNLLQKYGDESLEFLLTQVISTYAVGVETTSNAISLLFILLALNPEVQEQLYDEDQAARAILKGKDVEMSDLIHYPLLNSVMKESLRIIPVVPTGSKFATEDIKIGGYIIPKGTNVMCNIIDTQRSEENFKDPLTFKADRFLPENAKDIPPFAYIPFGTGPRVCLGVKFAQLAMKSCTLSVIRKFRIFAEYKSFEEMDRNTATTIGLRDRNDGRIRLERR